MKVFEDSFLANTWENAYIFALLNSLCSLELAMLVSIKTKTLRRVGVSSDLLAYEILFAYTTLASGG